MLNEVDFFEKVRFKKIERKLGELVYWIWGNILGSEREWLDNSYEVERCLVSGVGG